jgi:GNAT superfamily N-acetyltransferase
MVVPVIVRPRADVDLDHCVDMAEAVHQLDGYPAYLPTDLRHFLVSPDAYVAWVAEHEGEIVGHVALHRRTTAPAVALASKVLEQPVDRLGIVARLFVAPTARRLGVGQALLEVAWREAVSRGLWPVLDVATGLPGAIRLYETCGWTRAGAVTVGLPDGSSLDELVFLGPAPSAEVRRGSSSNPHRREP